MILEDFGDHVLKVKSKFSELTRAEIETIYREAWVSRCVKPDYSYAYEHVGVVAKQLMIAIPIAFQIAGEAFNKLAATRERYRKELANVAEETAREYASQFFTPDDELKETNIKLSPSRCEELLKYVEPETSRDEFQKVFSAAWVAYCEDRSQGDACDRIGVSGIAASPMQTNTIMSAAFDAIENLEDEFYDELKKQADNVAERLANWLFQAKEKEKEKES